MLFRKDCPCCVEDKTLDCDRCHNTRTVWGSTQTYEEYLRDKEEDIQWLNKQLRDTGLDSYVYTSFS